MPKFTYTENGAQKSVELTGDLFVVGSDAACGLVIADAAVSPVHCEFRRGANGWRVVDLESREGTSVNGEFVNQRVLTDGDVIQIGSVQGKVSGLQAASAAPAARPAAAPAAAPRAAAPAPRAAASRRDPGAALAASGRGRQASADAGDGGDGEERRPRRKKDSGTPILVIAGVVVGIVILGYLAIPNKDMGANYGLRAQALEAERKNDWQGVLRIASQANPNEDPSNFAEIETLRKKAEKALKSETTAVENNAAQAEWTALSTWWQANDFKDKAEYQSRLDAYLTKYAHLASVGPTQARQERIKYFGSASPGGVVPAGEAGFAAVKMDAEFFGGAGRFAEAIATLDEWWKRSSSSAPGLTQPVEALRSKLLKDAESWVDKQIAVAHMQKERGENRKAQNTLLNAAEKIGIPELAQKARAEISKL